MVVDPIRLHRLPVLHAQAPTIEDVEFPTMLCSPTDDKPASKSDLELSVTDRLDALEERLTEISDGHESLEGDVTDLQSAIEKAVHPGHSEATMKVSGRIHADYWAFPGDSPGVNAFESGDPDVTPQDRLGFRRIRLGVQGDVWKNMVYQIDMEFSGGNDPEFRDVYLGWKDVPCLQNVLIGNVKRPYGLDHLNSSRFNVFLERPFAIEAFNQDARRLGVVSYGVTDNQAWNWRSGVFNLQAIQNDGEYVSDHYQSEMAGRLANTLWYNERTGGRHYAHWAVSGTLAHPDGSARLFPERAPNEARFRTRPEASSEARWLDTLEIDGADDYQLLGLEGVINVGRIQLVGEYQNVWLTRDAGFPGNLQFHGGYVYLSYFLTGEHMPWDRAEGVLGRPEPFENFFLIDNFHDHRSAGWGAWQIAVRWSFADLTDGDVAGGIGESVTFGLNWYWNAYARMQLNYVYGNIHDHFPVAGQTFGDYHIVGTRFSIDF
jgi:phosphate-selective porin OprO/OprP